MSDIKNKLFESEWDATWEHLEAQPWYPDEQVVRFLSAYSSRRVGFGPGDVRFVNGKQPKGLDIGCGKGRHLITMAELNIEACGVDLSTVGVNFAREWMNSRKFTAVIEKSPMSKLPFPDDEFDFVICHGVLDHMTLSERTAGILETCRVLRQGGLFFFSVISKNDSAYGEGTYVEDDTWLIEDGFEKNAPQAFFDEKRIDAEFGSNFETLTLTLSTNKTLSGRSLIGTDKHYSIDERYYVLAEKL